eukprot:TRINITY_DN23406_c0_g1_i1.p1 TRINITY_DN23406_c0_g1~~TRINITY_DN23406_c0_g1_i1.p1  ORF type:complete len:440 (-),score=37.69 TRINITY_DN23406_c0_g1_i1:8-1327(-)
MNTMRNGCLTTRALVIWQLARNCALNFSCVFCVPAFFRKEFDTSASIDVVRITEQAGFEAHVRLGNQVSRQFILASADTAPWPNEDVTIETAGYRELKAVLNFLYAQHHGYKYVKYIYGPDASEDVSSVCFHPSAGPRHAAWCKLLSVAESMDQGRYVKSFAGVFWLDSDLHIASLKYSLEVFLKNVREGGECDQLVKRKRMGTRAALRRSHLMTAKEYGGCGGPVLTAMFYLRNTVEGRHILKEWWNSEACSQVFPWEQRALESYVLNAHDRPKGINVFDIDSFVVKVNEETTVMNDAYMEVPAWENVTIKNMFIHDGHVCNILASESNACEMMRSVRARRTLEAWGITDVAFQKAFANIRKHHTVVLSREKLDQISNRLLDDAISKKYRRMVQNFAVSGPGTVSVDESECRWIPIGWCKTEMNASMTQGCSPSDRSL